MHGLEVILVDFLAGQSQLLAVDSIDDQRLFELFQKLNIKNQDLLIVLEELLINAREHGDGKPKLFFQNEDHDLVFLMSDSGKGIHEQVPMNPRLSDVKGKSSSSILRLALEEGITGTGQIGRGMGLYYLSRLVKQHNASALLASNCGCVIQDSDLFHNKELLEDTRSTIIILRIAKKEAGL